MPTADHCAVLRQMPSIHDLSLEVTTVVVVELFVGGAGHVVVAFTSDGQ